MSAMSEMAAETRLLGGGLASLPRVNLLPPEIAEQVQFRKVQGGLALLLAGAVAGVGLLYMSASSDASTAQENLTAEQATTTTLQSQAAKFSDVNAVYARAAAAQAMLVQAMGSEVRYSRLLNDLSMSIPEGVWLTSASFSQAAGPAAATASTSAAAGLGTVTFAGVAYEHNDVAVWLEALAKQKGFSNPYLQSSTGALIGARKTVNWTTSVVLTEAALSGRYTQTGS